jgi:hypothetical protein
MDQFEVGKKSMQSTGPPNRSMISRPGVSLPSANMELFMNKYEGFWDRSLAID